MYEFQKGKSHMAIVLKNQILISMHKNEESFGGEDEGGKQDLVGLVTLEDLIEEILKEEIYDEADFDANNNPHIKIGNMSQMTDRGTRSVKGRGMSKEFTSFIVDNKEKLHEMISQNIEKSIRFDAGSMSEDKVDLYENLLPIRKN
jgi:CBS domain containing-hemolysin-like protein